MKKLLITLPCFDEEQVLEKNIREILNYAENNLTDYDWKILIIDNASTDKTFQIAQMLCQKDPRILVDKHIEKGRGAALKNVWQKYGNYDIYSYMDIDLATNLDSFATLVRKVEEGHNIVVGSRYVVGANVERSLKRKFMSKIYNLLLKMFLNVNFKDAQCGFKAFDKTSITNILPRTADTGWFWDTEFMTLAQQMNYKMIELPVTWRETRDEIRKSKVSPFSEVIRQLRNIKAMRKRIKNGQGFL